MTLKFRDIGRFRVRIRVRVGASVGGDTDTARQDTGHIHSDMLRWGTKASMKRAKNTKTWRPNFPIQPGGKTIFKVGSIFQNMYIILPSSLVLV